MFTFKKKQICLCIVAYIVPLSIVTVFCAEIDMELGMCFVNLLDVLVFESKDVTVVALLSSVLTHQC